MRFWILAAAAMALPATASGQVFVPGYVKKDGTYVAPHYRSSPDGNPYNNWSTVGNVNPYTGKAGTRNPYGSYGSSHGSTGSYSSPYSNGRATKNPYGSYGSSYGSSGSGSTVSSATSGSAGSASSCYYASPC